MIDSPSDAGEAAPVAGFRSGAAVIAGRPNVGKSTLLNALVGEKLSIVTPRPQTTRNRIRGILNLPMAQIAFVDTPGLHRAEGRALNRAMNRTAAAAVSEADLVVFVVEALFWTHEDEVVAHRIRKAQLPVVAAVNKVDRAKPRSRLLPYLAELAKQLDFLEIVPISALKSDNVEALCVAIARHLPESPPRFAADERTDRSIEFRIAETIREKLTLELNREVPYGIAVEIEQLIEADGQLQVTAAIWVDRAGQKPIVIGAKGERLKRVGRAARLELNHLLGRRLHLTLWVKVRKGWADSARALHELGLE